ncbi:hypothetical protein HYV91_02650 [Candidatus Wolfebacteria bacterium]|nr:hypothetical protein [Candidatus Wolfebacteria bacterium]
MTKLLKNREVIFIALSLLFLFLVGLAVFYSVSFLLDNFQKAISENGATDQQISKFNLKGLEELGIIK